LRKKTFRQIKTFNLADVLVFPTKNLFDFSKTSERFACKKRLFPHKKTVTLIVHEFKNRSEVSISLDLKSKRAHISDEIANWISHIGLGAV